MVSTRAAIAGSTPVMGGKPTPPKAPDPVAMSNAQTGSNIDTASASAALNAVNQQSPFGSVTYDQTGSTNIGGREVPRYTQTTTLSPEQQALYDAQTGVTKQAYDTAGTAIGQAQNTLSTPFSLNNLPPLQTSVGQPTPISSYESTAPRSDIPNSGQIQTGVGNAGAIQRKLAIPGGLQKTVATPGQQTSVADGGPIQRGIGADDFSADRQRVEDAFLSRFNEDIARREQSTISRLNAQGLQQGTEAYGTEMDLLNRSRNDARTQAILAGGQEQSRLFGLEQAQGQFANTAQGQQFGQNLAGGQFANQALNNMWGQNLGAGQFANQAQGQKFGQNAAQMQAANAAQAQQYGQLLSNMQATNQAQSQQFGQNLAGTELANQAAAQQTGQNQAQAAFGNTALQQGFGNSLDAAALANQARQQAISEQTLQRSQPINEVAALLGLGPGVQSPTGAPNFGINVGGTDVLGAYGMQQAALQNRYNQQMQQQNAMWGALGNLGGQAGSAAVFMSDARVKNIIRRVGQTAT